MIVRRYTASLNLAAAAAGAALAELKAGTKNQLLVREIGLFLTAATSTTVGLARATAQGTPTTSQAGLQFNTDDAAGEALLESVWSAAPTFAAPRMRRIVLPATIGASVVWSFVNERSPNDDRKPLIVKPSTSLVLVNDGGAAAGILAAYITWDELVP